MVPDLRPRRPCVQSRALERLHRFHEIVNGDATGGVISDAFPLQPTAKMIADIEEGQRLRGWIANSFAQIEFMLGDLILRSFQMAEYDGLPRTLPHGAPDRVKRLRRVLGTQGPLDPFAAALEELLDTFETTHEVRNLLAHGFCEYLFTPDGDAALQFQKWHRQPHREDARLIRSFRLQDLEREKQTMTALSTRAVLLFRNLHDHFGWVARPDK